MDNLKNITLQVKAILEADKQARNSDNYLYYTICKQILESQGMSIDRMPLALGLLYPGEYGLPKFESVRRARQKVQAAFPELASDARIEEMKAIREQVYKAFAISEVE